MMAVKSAEQSGSGSSLLCIFSVLNPNIDFLQVCPSVTSYSETQQMILDIGSRTQLYPEDI